MNRTAIMIAVIVAVASVAAVYIWCSQNRYYGVPSGDPRAFHLVDKKTGTVWWVRYSTKQRVEEK